MPPRKYNKKKRVYRKKRNYTVKPANRLAVKKPKMYGFTRGVENLLALESPTAGWLTTFDGSVVKTFSYSLNELPNYAEFVNLFNQYKLNMSVLKFYPSYSQVVSSTAPVASNNLIITVWANTHGTPLTTAFSDDDLLEIQRKKQWMFPLNKPTTIKMPLFQLRSTYGGTINTDYAVQRPRYINTLEPGTPHYGINVHIRKVDGSAFGSNSARLLIKEKVYLTTKQVK